MKTILDLLIITGIIVFITDITDFPSSVKKAISYITTKGRIVKDEYRIHVLDCSLCQVFWIGLLYLYLTDNFTLPFIGYVCLLSCMTEVIKDVILLAKDTCTTVINLMFRIIDWLNKTK